MNDQSKFLPTKQELQTLRKHLNNIREAVVLTHIGPDQDALMSLTAWSYILQINTYGIIRPIYEDEILLEVADMLSVQTIERVGNIYQALERHQPSHVFLVDINHIHRLTKKNQEQLKNFLENKTTTIVIDHHETPMDFKPAFSIIKPLASNCELIYYISKDLGLEINKAAQNLIIGILSDTAGCKYAQQDRRPSTYTTKALFELSKNPTTNMRDAVTRSYMKLTQDMLPFVQEFLNNLVIKENLAYTYADYTTLSDKEQIPARRAKSYVLQEILTKLNKPVYYILSKNKDKIKVSFRSIPPISIRKLAESLGGGGHDFAAGAYINSNDLMQLIEHINTKIKHLFS